MKTAALFFGLLGLSAAAHGSEPSRCPVGWNEISFQPTAKQFTLKYDENKQHKCLPHPAEEDPVFKFRCSNTNALKTEIVDKGQVSNAQVWPRRGCHLNIHVDVPREHSDMKTAQLHVSWKSARKLGMVPQGKKNPNYADIGVAKDGLGVAHDQSEHLMWQVPMQSPGMTHALDFEIEHKYWRWSKQQWKIMPIMEAKKGKGGQVAYGLQDIYLCVQPREKKEE